jgi:hypothetical protein
MNQQTHVGVRIHRAPRRFSEQDIQEVISLDAAFLEKQGLSPILRGAGTEDGETITCIGVDKRNNKGEDDSEPISWHCLASSGLDISITTTEPDLKQTWEIISSIRKNP